MTNFGVSGSLLIAMIVVVIDFEHNKGVNSETAGSIGCQPRSSSSEQCLRDLESGMVESCEMCLGECQYPSIYHTIVYMGVDAIIEVMNPNDCTVTTFPATNRRYVVHCDHYCVSVNCSFMSTDEDSRDCYVYEPGCLIKTTKSEVEGYNEFLSC